jgi:hypothetical protein
MAPELYLYRYAATSGITRVVNATDEQEDAVCITRTFAHACWLLAISATSAKVCKVGMTARFFYDLTIFLLHDFLQRVTAELTYLNETLNARYMLIQISFTDGQR